ncbi:hypothetical protein [Rathayibacter sp. AY1A7]|uniref:hypothetical protein n=1 Tax=Rathayibacter sp. AY1A7 TaxID=2080524 RepID=UPI000CE76C8C|nr:hypothetical protein [Rathayibacter sp. AY1A7]PPF21029.1 hypothetical protein C5B95_06360 [Rathayibacter sp. AY1A7]
MSSRVARARELLDTLAQAVNDPEVLVDADGRKVRTHATLAAGAIVLGVGPKVEWPTPGVERVTWTVTVTTTDSPDDPFRAWEQLDALLDVVADWAPFGALGEAESTRVAWHPGDDPLPAYIVTLTEDTIT